RQPLTQASEGEQVSARGRGGGLSPKRDKRVIPTQQGRGSFWADRRHAKEASMSQPDDALSNLSSSPMLEDVLAVRYSRRQLLTGGLVAAGAAWLSGGLRPRVARAGGDLLGFRGVPVSK